MFFSVHVLDLVPCTISEPHVTFKVARDEYLKTPRVGTCSFIRPVKIVEHAAHNSSIKNRKLAVVDDQVAGAQLYLLQGMFFILEQTPDNFPEYQFP